MNITVRKVVEKRIDCAAHCVSASNLGQMYAPSYNYAVHLIKSSIERDELFEAVTEDGICAGVLWFELHGAFHTFPYLHMILVEEPYQKKGVGKLLLHFFENYCKEQSSFINMKWFLLVNSKNERAKRFYVKQGYQTVAVLNDLYRKGIKEELMEKCN